MKTRYKLLIISAIPIIAIACRKDLQINEPDFQVSVPKNTYKVGDTVFFSINGSAEYLTFYSGETGNNYANKERTTLNGSPKVKFSTYRQNGTQENTLQLLVSKNFSGKFDADIGKATWTDITSRAIFSADLDNTASGDVDLSDFAAENKTVFLAFKYTGLQTSTGPQRTWTIKNFQLFTVLANGSSITTVGAIPAAGWIAVSVKNEDQKWTQNATQLQMVGGAANAAANEDWIVAPLRLNLVSPDQGVGIKDLAGKLTSYQYILKEAGAHEMVFIGSNANVEGIKTIVRKININVTP
jgi:hypothetical protein